MGKYIFTFIFGFLIMSTYDRFLARRQPCGWFVNKRENLVIALGAVLISMALDLLRH